MRIMNKKQVKQLTKELKVDINIKDYVFIKDFNKIFITNKGIKQFDLSNLNIKQIGLLFAEVKNNKYYLSDSAKDLFLK